MTIRVTITNEDSERGVVVIEKLGVQVMSYEVEARQSCDGHLYGGNFIEVWETEVYYAKVDRPVVE